MKKIVSFLFTCIILSCSSDKDEILEEIENSAPVISTQELEIAENSEEGTSIGTISASDADADKLTFEITNNTGLEIDSNSGEITVGSSLELDYETEQTIIFIVSVFDGTTTTTKDITLTVTDVDEQPAELSAAQLELIGHFKFLTLGEAATSTTVDVMRKWETNLKLHLKGAISNDFKATVEDILEEYNMILEGSHFTISLVETEQESNLQLFFGSKQDLESVWPDFYDVVKDLSVDGFSQNNFVGNFFSDGKVWVSSDLGVLFKHEFGHALGLGHSTSCDSGSASVMCSSIDLDSDLLQLDQDVIRYFYHNDMDSGLDSEEIEVALSAILLSE